MSLHGNDFESDFGFGGGGLFGNAVKASGAGGALGPLGGRGPEQTNFFGSGDIFGKGGTASIALGGLQTLGSLWNSFQANKLAKKTFKFQKRAYKEQLSDNRQVYDTSLQARIEARYAAENRSPEEAAQKFAENRLG